MKRRKRSASSWGNPRNLTMTRTGICPAYSMAASKLGLPLGLPEQFAAQVPGEGLEGGGRPGPEGGQQHPAGHGVEGRVRSDRRGQPDRCGQVVGTRPLLADHDRAGGEVLGVVGHLGDQLMGHRQPRPAVPVAVRDGAALAQVLPDRVRVGHPAGVGVIEVGGPVLDRGMAAGHGCSSVREMAVSQGTAVSCRLEGAGGRPSRRLRHASRRRACRGCWTRARWPSWAKNEQFGGVVAVAAAGGHQAQHFELALGEPERRGAAGLGSLPRQGGHVDAGPPGERADLLEQRVPAKTAGQISRAAKPDGRAFPVPGR